MRRLSRLAPHPRQTGLLSLIAIRAGAGCIDCVEMNPVLAATAQATLKSSRRPSERGVAITVWNCISTELVIDADGAKGPRGKAETSQNEEDKENEKAMQAASRSVYRMGLLQHLTVP